MQELIAFLLRTSNSIEFIIIGILLKSLIRYVDYPSISRTINNVAWGLIILGIIREIASFYDYYYDNSSGIYTLSVNTLVYAYIIYVIYRVRKILKLTENSPIKFNSILDSMINQLNDAISKAESKSHK